MMVDDFKLSFFDAESLFTALDVDLSGTVSLQELVNCVGPKCLREKEGGKLEYVTPALRLKDVLVSFKPHAKRKDKELYEYIEGSPQTVKANEENMKEYQDTRIDCGDYVCSLIPFQLCCYSAYTKHVYEALELERKGGLVGMKQANAELQRMQALSECEYFWSTDVYADVTTKLGEKKMEALKMEREVPATKVDSDDNVYVKYRTGQDGGAIRAKDASEGFKPLTQRRHVIIETFVEFEKSKDFEPRYVRKKERFFSLEGPVRNDSQQMQTTIERVKLPGVAQRIKVGWNKDEPNLPWWAHPWVGGVAGIVCLGPCWLKMMYDELGWQKFVMKKSLVAFGDEELPKDEEIAGNQGDPDSFLGDWIRCHPGFGCDKSEVAPIMGVRYTGKQDTKHFGMDLMEEEWEKLQPWEKKDFEPIQPTGTVNVDDILPVTKAWLAKKRAEERARKGIVQEYEFDPKAKDGYPFSRTALGDIVPPGHIAFHIRQCRKTGRAPIIGIRYYNRKEDEDICSDAYDEMWPGEQKNYEVHSPALIKKVCDFRADVKEDLKRLGICVDGSDLPGTAGKEETKTVKPTFKIPIVNAPYGKVGIHPGFECDLSGMYPIVGVRFHKKTVDLDVCEEEFRKLNVEDQLRYEAILPTVFVDAKALGAEIQKHET
jgi:hypothetical protein